MTWGWLVALAAVYFAIISPGFRVFLLIAGLMAGATIWMMFETDKKRNEEYRSKLARSRSMIPENSLEFRDVLITPGMRFEYDKSQNFSLSASVKNNSPYTLSSVSISLTAQDCDAQNKCEIIGNATSSTYGASVPPGQVRAISLSYTFKGLPPVRGRLDYWYQVGVIEADVGL